MSLRSARSGIKVVREVAAELTVALGGVMPEVARA
jgi:hypothetical protein